MNEHDDDLTSEVHEGADLETDSFPDTEDALDDGLVPLLHNLCTFLTTSWIRP